MSDFQFALTRTLAKALPGFEHATSITRLSGGASQETWAIDAVMFGVNHPLILRRSPDGKERALDTSHQIGLATEAVVIETCREAGVPVPRVRCVLQSKDGVGSGYIMDRLPGETTPRKILHDTAFDEIRPLLARQCGEVLASIHQVDVSALRTILPVQDGPALLRRYRDIYDAHDYPHPVFELAFKWLEPRLAGTGLQTLVHGDFRHGNLLISPRGIEGILDWELAHIGDPLEDIGWLCTNSWRFGVAGKVVGGFGDLQDLVAGYQASGGGEIDLEQVKNWIVYGSLKWGVMCMGMYQGFRADHSVERAAIGRRAVEAESDLINLIIHGKI
ncbi:MAG: phosphotransferase family protein [Alphaproteobacteria bacterium]|nr:phosphotransferase family protein [Alphaproteobacteria bacterium]